MSEKVLKSVLTVFAADILALFVMFTLAGSSAVIVRIISAVCGIGILTAVTGSFAYKCAEQDKNAKNIIVPAVSVSLPGVISWGVLLVSVMKKFEYYRWHKLLNGFFIQIFNFIEPDASSSALTVGEVLAMLPITVVPSAIFTAAYFIAHKKM
ncbi:MAG: hypothetical protein IJM38_04200 [Ruminococcus sp.]|nr:hypothetical protein [Ruminococcus sp.]